jgi:hypothetical protein
MFVMPTLDVVRVRSHWTWFATATRFALIEHGRNDTPAPMRLRATGETPAPRGNELTEISGALNAVTLITGFTMFAATFSGNRFDRRLAMARYPHACLVLPKVTAPALVSVAALIALVGDDSLLPRHAELPDRRPASDTKAP